MDIRAIKADVVQLYRLLKEHGVRADIFILYGSYARGNPRADSDIDVAVISRDFGKDRFKEGSKLNYLASKINPRIEAVPISLADYFSKENISPLLHEITTTGIVLL
jgi:predicted nucleotidyltransferase